MKRELVSHENYTASYRVRSSVVQILRVLLVRRKYPKGSGAIYRF